MLVRDLLTTDGSSISPDTPVGVIISLLAERGISGVPVTDADGTLLGMVTEADLVRRLAFDDKPRQGWLRSLFADRDRAADRYARARGSLARDVMTTELLTVTEDTTAEHAAHLLEEHKVRRLPVLRDGRLLGVVTRSDLLRALFPSPADHTAARPSDCAIRGAITTQMGQEPWASAPYLSFDVTDGIVEFRGYYRSDAARRALAVLAANTPGVVRVVDHATRMPSGNMST
jgi:CBS domain-containing protein